MAVVANILPYNQTTAGSDTNLGEYYNDCKLQL